MTKKDKIIEYLKGKDGKMYVLKQRSDGLCVIEINGRIGSIHSSLELGQTRMKTYRSESAN